MPIIDSRQARAELALRELARRDLKYFVKYLFPKYQFTLFHENYIKLIDMFAKGKIRKLIVSVPPQHGKQIDDNEFVLTTNGIKKHGDLCVGDYVFHPSGKPVRIIDIIPQQQKCSIQLTFSNGQKINCHENHEWTIIKGRRRKITVESKHFVNNSLWTGEKGKRGSRYIYQLPFSNCLDIKKRILSIEPYCFGVWLGDGKSSNASFYSAKNENDIVEYFDSVYDRWTTYTHKKTGVRQFMYNKSVLQKKLEKNNLINNKHIPIDFILSSKKQRLKLLAGLIDTDGSLHKKTGQYRFTNINKRLIDDVCLLLSTLGYSYSVTSVQPREYKNSYGIKDKNVCYQIGFTPLDTIPCRIKRKQSTIKPKRRMVSICNATVVEESEKRRGKCITVDSEDGLYLVGKKLVATHNSEISTRYLTSFLFGINPDLNIAVGSYNQSFARKFSRQIKRIMRTKKYKNIFKETKLPGHGSDYSDTMDEWDIVDKNGTFKAVGRGGGITGNPVDIMIMDDVYKDYAEANSPIIRENVVEWYQGSILTRLHNDSQQLIVFTRWHEEDLVGFVEKEDGPVISVKSFSDIKENDPYTWYKINFEALMTCDPTEIDNREIGEALWPKRHSKKKLEKTKALDQEKFEGLYQGNPRPLQGLLYSKFGTYDIIPADAHLIKFYTDSADTGNNFTVQIVYSVSNDNTIYIRDVYMSDEAAEVTEQEASLCLVKNKVNMGFVESNNGGRGWARSVERIMREEFKYKSFNMQWFHQSENKEARIISNAGNVQRSILVPPDWKARWPEFYGQITSFRKKFRSNKFDDAPDALTGVYEKANQGIFKVRTV